MDRNKWCIKRLADSSAFVVFDKETYETFVIQKEYMHEYFTSIDNFPSIQEFEGSQPNIQINWLMDSGIVEQLS